MKKKPASSRRASSESNGKVGSGMAVRRKVDWPKLGRRPIERTDGVAELAKQIKEIRERQGETIGGIALDVGVPPATLIKFEERAHPVSVQVLTSVVERLGCELQIKEPQSRRKK